MTPGDLRAWQAAMGYTYDTAAQALGVSRGTYADWIAGRSRTSGKPVKISLLAGLACAALANGLCVWTPAEVISAALLDFEHGPRRKSRGKILPAKTVIGSKVRSADASD